MIGISLDNFYFEVCLTLILYGHRTREEACYFTTLL